MADLFKDEDLQQLEGLLLKLLSRSASPASMQWLEGVSASLRQAFERRPFYYAFSGVSRRFDRRSRLDIEPDSSTALSSLAPGVDFGSWDEFRLARVLLLLLLGEQPESERLETYAALLNTADLREQAALYSALPFLPPHPELIEAAIDGLRSNIVDVFDSIALGNPYPAAHFPEAAWNQMVLKAIFISRPLYRVVGLDGRRNKSLAEAVVELARERWAAGRQLTPEAWRNVAGFLRDDFADEVAAIAASERPEDREAAALLTSGAEGNQFAEIASGLERERERIAQGELDWDRLGRALESV